MRCPECGSRSIGRVGADQYYCWDCCVEFNLGRGQVRVYYLDAEGELTVAGPTPQLAGRKERPGRSPRATPPAPRQSPVA